MGTFCDLVSLDTCSRAFLYLYGICRDEELLLEGPSLAKLPKIVEKVKLAI